ncbi:hypothetical protein D3C71_231150 [compost metagenome]
MTKSDEARVVFFTQGAEAVRCILHHGSKFQIGHKLSRRAVPFKRRQGEAIFCLRRGQNPRQVGCWGRLLKVDRQHPISVSQQPLCSLFVDAIQIPPVKVCGVLHDLSRLSQGAAPTPLARQLILSRSSKVSPRLASINLDGRQDRHDTAKSLNPRGKLRAERALLEADHGTPSGCNDQRSDGSPVASSPPNGNAKVPDRALKLVHRTEAAMGTSR